MNGRPVTSISGRVFTRGNLFFCELILRLEVQPGLIFLTNREHFKHEDGEAAHREIKADNRMKIHNHRTFPYREVLEKPRSHYICGHFGEDASFLLPLLVLIIFVSCAR